MLQTHYRQPIDWTLRGLEGAERTLLNWANILQRNQTGFHESAPPSANFLAALSDDLNTPMAIAEMHKLAEKARKGHLESAQSLHQAGKFIGIFSEALMSSTDFRDIGEVATGLLPEEARQEINSKVEARNAARKAKNFKEADRIRDALAAQGVELEDKKDGSTTWRVKR
jgi:cysteinyl-tRNA synthetase